jgi:L-cysteate sulfo-lyase
VTGPRTGERVRLGTWPTPLEPAPRLAAHLGLRPEDLWVKRDDLTGLPGLFGHSLAGELTSG